MAKSTSRLGRGLGSLISGGAVLPAEETATKAPVYTSSDGPTHSAAQIQATENPELLEISTNQIVPNPYQPRKTIHQESIKELAASIEAEGLLLPIVVRKILEDYQLIAGERRWRAAQMAGLDRVPVVIKAVTDEAAIAIGLIENIQREDLNPVEEGLGLKRLQDEFGFSQEQVALAVGRSRSAVANLLRLLNLERDVLSMLERGEIDTGHAKVLLALTGGDQVRAAQQVIKRGLSVRQTEALVRGWGATENTIPAKDPNVSRLEEDLSARLGAKVRIQHQQNGRGRLEVQYTTLDELDGILKRIQ